MNTNRNTTRPREMRDTPVPAFQTARTAATALALLAALPCGAIAAEEDPLTETFDQIWGLATLYKDDSNPILEEFKLRGRYQGQYWDVDADSGSQSNWEDRRSRFGLDAKMFEKQIELRADFQSNDGFDDIYDGLVDAYVRYKPASWISFTAGRTKPLIGQYDWLESSNNMPTFERSQIFNQLGINRATSFTVEGTSGEWIWRGGVYSNDTPNGTGGTGSFGEGEFGDMSGGVSFSLGGGYDFKELLCTDKADFRLDWIHSEREAGDLVLNKYDDILSSTFWVKEGDWGVVLEAYHATGGDGTNSDVFGFYIEPTYDIIPKKLQLVGRYSFTHSQGDFGVVGQTRYEKPVAAGGNLGDTYNAFYGGVQYFIHGDKLKLMAGAEWSRLESDVGTAYDGVTLLTGIRLYF